MRHNLLKIDHRGLRNLFYALQKARYNEELVPAAIEKNFIWYMLKTAENSLMNLNDIDLTDLLSFLKNSELM